MSALHAAIGCFACAIHGHVTRRLIKKGSVKLWRLYSKYEIWQFTMMENSSTKKVMDKMLKMKDLVTVLLLLSWTATLTGDYFFVFLSENVHISHTNHSPVNQKFIFHPHQGEKWGVNRWKGNIRTVTSSYLLNFSFLWKLWFKRIWVYNMSKNREMVKTSKKWKMGCKAC